MGERRRSSAGRPSDHLIAGGRALPRMVDRQKTLVEFITAWAE
jgi:hypothetical protein